MARARVDFFSDVLELSTSMSVLLPQPTSAQIGMAGAAGDEPPPVLYLLHGLSDDDTAWSRRTSIERYVAPLGLAVVMPQVNRSFYADEVYGNRYWTFLSEELPALVDRFFRVSTAREDTFVAGLSMGGYGAMKWALREPGRFAAAASLSGALDLVPQPQEEAWRTELMARVYGDAPLAGGPDDLVSLLGQADPAVLPELFVCCGTEDRLLEQNQRFLAAATARGIGVAGGFGSGEHEWGYWDRTIQDVLAWLPLRRGSVGALP